MYLVSACLAGFNSRYDGSNNLNEDIRQLVIDGKAIVVCPEQMGGCPTPRRPCEISGGAGKEVLNKNARVINDAGEDVTEEFIAGA